MKSTPQADNILDATSWKWQLDPGCHFLFSLAEYFKEERKTIWIPRVFFGSL